MVCLPQWAINSVCLPQWAIVLVRLPEWTIGVGGDGPWEQNHSSLVDDKVDPENFNLQSHNIVPRPHSAIAKTVILSRLVLLLRLARSRFSNQKYKTSQFYLFIFRAKNISYFCSVARHSCLFSAADNSKFFYMTLKNKNDVEIFRLVRFVTA